MPVLLDTHAWVWSIDEKPRLSTAAIQAIEDADFVFVSPITLYEICQKVRIGKWPEMARYVGELQDFLAVQSISFAPLTADISIRAGLLDWLHRDPSDRILAATALAGNMDFVSADTAFDEVPGLRRIW